MTYLDYIAPKSASVPAKRKSYTKRALVYGAGSNDYPTPIEVDGKIIKSYDLWRAMLQRCYSSGVHKKRPTYIGCSVAKEWLSFSTFERWFTENSVDGWHLDKDLLIAGNRVYGPETCVFVPHRLNTLLTDSRSARGEFPLGVCFHKYRQKYQATVSIDGDQKYLGLFDTPLAAHQAWQLAKAAIIEAFPTTDPRIRAALDKRAAQLRDDHAHGRITVKL